MVDLREVGGLEGEAHAELRQPVVKPRRRCRVERRRALRPARLQPDLHMRRVGERTQQAEVGVAERLQVAEDEHHGLVAHRHLDLRHTVPDRQPADKRAQPRDQRRHVRRQDQAALHVGDERGAALAKADHRAAFLLDVAHREPRAPAVAPLLAVDRREHRFGLHLADALEAVLEPALLGGDLGARVGVLDGAAAAILDPGAGRHAAAARRLEHGDRARGVELGLGAQHLGVDGLAAERALDEHDLAFGIARDAVAAGIERVDAQPDQRARNSRQCGALSFSSAPRSSAHSFAYCASASAPRSFWKRR